jgi:hypothetical protein
MNSIPPFVRPVAFAVTAGCIAGCVGAPPSAAGVRPGAFVEAKGRMVEGLPLVEEIDELPRGVGDKSDKLEVTAVVEQASAERVVVLGTEFAVTAATEHEDRDKSAIAPFVAQPGDWLRIKARHDEDGHRARTLRRIDPREQWQVEGEVGSFDLGASRLSVGGVALSLAQDPDVELLAERDPNDPLSLFLADDQKAVPFTIRVGERWRFGGQVSTSLEWNDEFDLDRTDTGDRFKPSLRGKVDALWLLDDVGSYALGEVAFGRDETHREGGETTHQQVFEVTRAFASLRVAPNLQVLAGRQDFDEEREWLYDEILDGIRAVARAGDVQFEVAVAQGREVAAERNDTEDTGLLVGNVRWRPDRDWLLGAYVLQRTDRTAADFEPLLFGVRSLHRPRYGFGHWLELGVARGAAGGRDVDGHAFDLGVTHGWDAPWRPTVAVGYAFATGERDGAGTVGYRQSGLQDNNAKLGGVTGVRYYGELFDPELANLGVATLAFAVRPANGLSVSLLLHDYRQHVAATAVPDSGLRTTPNGLSRDLGRELDVVVGYRLERRLTLELTAGRFFPGDAYAPDDPANLLELTARFSF